MDTSTPQLKCSWPACTDKKVFSHKSELSKHMYKHTRPFTCKNPLCNGINFGDRAGLQRHEREKHQAAKYFCQIATCPRHTKGFARKNHLDLHMGTRHKPDVASSEASPNSELSRGLECVEDGEMGEGLSGLKMKLSDLEARKKMLAASQMEVEEDILAVERTLRLCGCGSS